MRISERMYPYPVIKEEDAYYKDFKKASFDFDVAEEEEENRFFICVTIDSNSIPECLIPNENNNLSYGIQIESIKKKKRYFISNKKSPTFKIEIDGKNYTGKVEINAYIYVDSDVNINFDALNNDIDPFYQETVQYKKGNIIALSRPTRTIYVRSDGKNAENPIRVVKEKDLQDNIRYDIDNSQIKINLDERNYEIYSKYGNDPLMKNFVLNALVVPAVSQALLEMKNGNIDYLDGNCQWANLFISILQNKNVEFSDVGESVSIENATQLVLGQPLEEMFEKLKNYGENQ